MRKSLIAILFFATSLFGFLGFSTNRADAQTVNEFTKVDSLRVGDTFDFAITLSKGDKYDAIAFPDSSHLSPTFEIRSKKQFKVTGYKDSVQYKLQFFGTADTLIPRLPVTLVRGRDTTVVYTKPVPVGFRSILSKKQESFRPLKPIFEFARAWWSYIAALLLLILAGYYGWQYYQKRQQAEEEKEEVPEFTPVPFVNPLKQLKGSIRELENTQLVTHEDYKAFYSDLGDAIRQYFESLYKLPALESTSRELLAMLRKRAVDQNLIDDTQAVLQEADMVKFAKFNPTSEQAHRALIKAHNFIERAREVDGPRIDHMRRKHQQKMEAQREDFYRQHLKRTEN